MDEESTVSRSDQPSALGRRRWLIAAPAGLLALGWAARRWWIARPGTQARGPLAELEGRRIDRWTVERVLPIHLGAIPIVLSTATGQRYQVDVLARDPDGPQGVADTEHLSLFIVNGRPDAGSAGRRPTDEEQGLGAMVLAQALGSRPAPQGLLAHGERRRRHPRGAFALPLT